MPHSAPRSAPRLNLESPVCQGRIPALLFWQRCVLALIIGIVASRAPLAGGVCACLFCLVQISLPRQRLALLLVCLGIGVGAGVITHPRSAPSSSAWPAWFEANTTVRVKGVVQDVTGLADRRLRIILTDVQPVEGGIPLPGKVNWTWDQSALRDGPRPLPGQQVELTGKIRPVTGFANAGVSNSIHYWEARGVYFTIWTMAQNNAITLEGQGTAPACKREAWRQGLVAALGGSAPAIHIYGTPDSEREAALGPGMSQSRAMIPALIFGDRYSLDTTTFDQFSRAGLVHSLALSGQHLALAGTVAAVLVWLLSQHMTGLFLYLPRRTLALAGGLPFAALYIWLGNAPPSLIRASLMMFFGALLWLGCKPITLLDILLFAVACFILVWPQAVFDLSVQLSVLSVAGIALALPWLNRMDQGLKRKITTPIVSKLLRAVCLLLGTSLAVQIATLPVVLLTFGRLPPLFALNLLWLPILGAIILPCAALSLLVLLVTGPGPVADLFFFLAAFPADIMLYLLDGLDNRHLLFVVQGLKPTDLTIVGYTAAIAALTVTVGRPISFMTKVLLISALLLLPSGALQREWEACLAQRQEKITLRVLDVGQGQALVLEWPQGRLLLDGGGFSTPRLDSGRDIVAQALTVNRPPRLHMLMLSHGDMDHIRGLAAVAELFQVEQALHSTLPLKGGERDRERFEAVRQRRGIPLKTLEAGDVLDLGHGLKLEVIHPPPQGNFSSNNGSLVIRLTRHGQGLALLCGDAESPALRRILREGRDVSAQVIVVPHHGSAKSMWPEFYEAVDPHMALISCSAYNSFGFPRQAVLEELARLGIPWLTTAEHGELRVTWTKDADCEITGLRLPPVSGLAY